MSGEISKHICPVCGIEILPTRWVNRDRIVYKKFCSLKCKGKEDFKRRHDYYQDYWLTRPNLFDWKKEKPCEMCGKMYMPQKSVSHTCSRKCCTKRNRLVSKESKKEYDLEWTRKDRKVNPEKYRMRTKMRRYRLRIAGAPGGATFNSEFSQHDWEMIKKKFNYQCQMCGKNESAVKLTIDHVIPISKGGWHDVDNIQPLCAPCNSSKRDKLPSDLATYSS